MSRVKPCCAPVGVSWLVGMSTASRLLARRTLLHLALLSAFSILLCLFMPQPASAQSVSVSISASPDPFGPDDDITVSVDGDYDSETIDWPCDMDWEDGGCAPVYHTFYIYGSDGYSTSFGGEDDLESTGHDSGDVTDDGSEGQYDEISYDVLLDVEYCDEWYSDCWDATDEAGYTAEPSGGFTLNLSGSPTMWNFDGASPYDGSLTTTLTIDSSAEASTSWINYSPSVVTMSTDVGEEVVITPNTGASSSSPEDVHIAATDGVFTVDVWITVLRPVGASAAGWSNYCQPPPDGDWGWYSFVFWTVNDNLGNPLPATSFRDTETWTDDAPIIDWQGNVDMMSWWPFPVANGGAPNKVTNNDGEIEDEITNFGPDPDPNWPATSCTDSVAVDHWGQDWSIEGIFVSHDTVYRFTDHGEADK